MLNKKGDNKMGALQTYFLDVITKHYVDFSGRATRKQFWLFLLFNALVAMGLYLLSGMDGTLGSLFNVVYVLYSLAIFLPALAIQIRRLHDAGFSGWLWLLMFLPLLGGLILFVLYLLPTKENNY